MQEETHYAFIPYRRQHEYIALGWQIVSGLVPPHSWWSVLGEWKGEGPPRTPKGVLL